MTILVFAEQRDGKIKKSSFEAVSAATGLAKQLGAECVALVVGHGVTASAAELGTCGATKVLAVDSPSLEKYSLQVWESAIVQTARNINAAVVILSATQMGKDLGPRVAVGLEAGLAADCIALSVNGGSIVASRPVYAGKAVIDVEVLTAVKVFSLRPNVFPVAGGGAPATVDAAGVSVKTDAVDGVVDTKVASGRPDVAEADIIVSGGRGLKGPEHFHLVEELADAFGAAVGASRAVVDAGWRPHSEQVGQTGKTVSPTLYVACGISGAVQHLAGMNSSKYIVAINKDKDAPIFQIADYGIVGDALELLPEFTVRVKELTGR
jgi:electron transfer flavoprotein alpha subunit